MSVTGNSGLLCPECGARASHLKTCSRAAPDYFPEVLSAFERAARVAWIAYLSAQLDGPPTHEVIDRMQETHLALPESERASHEQWRNEAVAAAENALLGFLPAVAVRDESPVPSGPDATLHYGRNRGIDVPSPRPTLAELGYFESVSRSLRLLPNAQRIRVLVASLVACSFEADLPPVELSMMVTRSARRYFARLKLIASPAAYDGNGLIGYAFPPEKPS